MLIGSPGVFLPQLPQHPACGSARGASLRIEKIPHEMESSKAGYDTNRQDYFTRSGALQSLRPARLTLCRGFKPSPCPTHYGGRLATMPSADFCSITSGVAARRAVRVTVGSGGNSNAFALALSPAPIAARTASGTDLPG